MIGTGHISGNAFAMGFGGGVDVNVGDSLAIRVVQMDWIPNRLGGDLYTSEFRLGFGIVFRAGT
jgi:opacity protein-like surface antigen